jgi:hypothetical protein
VTGATASTDSTLPTGATGAIPPTGELPTEEPIAAVDQSPGAPAEATSPAQVEDREDPDPVTGTQSAGGRLPDRDASSWFISPRPPQQRTPATASTTHVAEPPLQSPEPAMPAHEPAARATGPAAQATGPTVHVGKDGRTVIEGEWALLDGDGGAVVLPVAILDEDVAPEPVVVDPPTNPAVAEEEIDGHRSRLRRWGRR